MKTSNTTFFFIVTFFLMVTFSGVKAQESNENTVTIELNKEVAVNEVESDAMVSVSNKVKSTFDITPMTKKETLMISGNSTKTYLLRTIQKILFSFCIN